MCLIDQLRRRFSASRNEQATNKEAIGAEGIQNPALKRFKEELDLRLSTEFSSEDARSRAVRNQLQTIARLLEKAIFDLESTSAWHLREIAIAGYVAVGQGYWRSGRSESLRQDVLQTD